MQDQEIRHQPSCEDELNIGLLTVAANGGRALVYGSGKRGIQRPFYHWLLGG